MKIIEDRVTIYPPHAICKADIPVIISRLPQNWIQDIKTVRISALQKLPRSYAFYRRYNHTLEICSRGISKRQAIQYIMIELAAHGLEFKYRRGHRLSHRDEEKIQREISCLVEDIVPKLSQKKVWLDE
jgi:hypothetical protein